MTRMTTEKECKREVVENAMASVANALILVDLIDMRMKQAIDRSSGLTGLLGPGLEHVRDVDAALLKARAVMGEFWQAGENRGW